ncbi:hypothetical protein SAMN04515695_2801 [Pseudovibrio sp. Tun.PSC04-5.I4]|nr:hypothetical protein SAMN04515695_2801 [Pseudovibrio sp. Tun.PSC04-5.I4]
MGAEKPDSVLVKLVSILDRNAQMSASGPDYRHVAA